ncbi:MAG: T9SS type A sorting domain-containing protein [Candidatus Eisenbacteria bacterium]|uniref:T9SS type A sorting domain-containing protein n=1 Tax=Eiseniibacteriota bacterium TaxID=2212470 RepID=A0A7Y2E7E9_UNCEI|nr:T9SS type A sorting domain-containing protein [Candidatus Eisenbacteria bacterium]
MRTPSTLCTFVLTVCAAIGVLATGPQAVAQTSLNGGGGASSTETGSALVSFGQTLTGSSSQTAMSVDSGLWPSLVESGVTPVRLLAFQADWVDEGLRLHWEVAGDASDFAGFYVYRELFGERERVSDELILSQHVFEFVDEDPPVGEVSYWLAEMSRSGSLFWHGPLTLELDAKVQPILALAQSVPNPFFHSTRISFQIPEESFVRLRVFDLSGRVIRTLQEDSLPAGSFEATWNGENRYGQRVSSGMYFYRLETSQGNITRKLLLSS